MITIPAVFIGGIADGRKMQIDPKMSMIQIPKSPEELTTSKAHEWTGWQGKPRSTDIDFVTYRVHILGIRGHGNVAICTTDFDLNQNDLLVTLLEGYNPKKEQQP